LCTMLQERFLDRLEDYAAARGKYIIDKQLLGSLRRDAVIMHPLPRVDEVCCCSRLSCAVYTMSCRSQCNCTLAPQCGHLRFVMLLVIGFVTIHQLHFPQITTEVDDDPRAAYFRQAKNGLYIRMALLKLATMDRTLK
jgi:aspartate carbamoyltransferase catalytic subunit